MKKLYGLSILLIVLFVSCRENERVVPLNIAEPKLVLWAELAVNELAEITLTTTAENPLMPIVFEEQIVKDATVVLVINEVELDTLLFKDGKYYSKQPVKDKTDYVIKAYKTSYPNITTNSIQVPSPVVFIDTTVLLLNEENLDCRGIDFGKYINFEWIIDSNTTNYYRIENYSNCRIYQFKNFQYDCAFGATYTVGEYFRDNCFNATTAAITLSGTQRTNDLLDNANLHVFTEARYLFEQSEQSIDAFAQGFAEPRPTYSNVQGGYGIMFASRRYEFLF